MVKPKQKDKWRWEKGDLRMEFSQCAYCKNAIDYITCTEYGGKPLKYIMNDQKCPKRSV
ncbi:MAG: hypothetical protein ACOX37_09005 [Bacillota bacterium]|jgi:hypothetical protein